MGALEICGPLCFAKFLKNDNPNIKLFYKILNDNDWKKSIFVDEYKNIIIKISYNNYYNENNYLITTHYGVMWQKNNIYNNIMNNHKINYISGIAWINLDRAIHRKTHMENILQNINIPSYRISAVDGKNEDFYKIINGINLERKMNNYEIACTLSHLKAIQHVSKLEGSYFIICEDDIIFSNLNIINTDLENIIKKCPDFDILLLHKIYIHKLNEEYTNWNEHINRLGIDYQIAGAAAYVISRKGINNILGKANYENNILNYNMTNKFDVSDMFLYIHSNTYVYKYNFIAVLGVDSNIHAEHIIHHNRCEEVQNKYILENCI